MPQQTFFNLDPEKRQAVVDTAVEEFAQFAFEQASLSKIVEKCGIAKGSMYQYFTDKLDLYLYIVDLAYEKKRSYVGRAFDQAVVEDDIFAVLEEYYLQSYRFAREHPLLHQVANKFWDSRAEVLRSELEEGRLTRAHDFSQFLADAMDRGDVNANLDPEAVFFVYHAVGKDLIDFFDQGRNGQFLKRVLDVLRFGLTTRKEEV
ncbi:MAG: TetR/AcrR family transcriptional regulator [Limnochordia bacterium]|jgi:AcrR family transcriptional regulator|nr:TetR/AcrR family transcriptional regulator [Limnochordia bacterium]